MPGIRRIILTLAVCLFPAFPFIRAVHAATTERVSVSSTGEQGDWTSWHPCISADGRFVAFSSIAGNLAPVGPLSLHRAYVHDRMTGSTECISVSNSGEPAGDYNGFPGLSISADGRFVAFESWADNVVPGDTQWADVFVRDRLDGITERVSVTTSGEEPDGNSGECSLSVDGRFVAFESSATNLVAGDTNGEGDVFVRDRLTGATERVCISSGGEQGNGFSGGPSISADGRFVAFSSWADNLVPGDTNTYEDVFVHDRVTGVTERVSVGSSGQQVGMGGGLPSISADGRFVVFSSWANNLVPGISTMLQRIFLRDRAEGTTECVSVSSTGEPANGHCIGQYDQRAGSISADGRYVAFASWADNLVPADNSRYRDLFIRDRLTGVTELIGVSSSGEQANDWTAWPAISADGRYLAFESEATTLVPEDTNGYCDVFVRDLGPPRLADLDIRINQEEACTNSRQATLGLVFPQGYNEMRLRSDPGDWGPWEPSVAQKPWTLPAGDGVKTVCMQCRDGLGNVSQEVCDDILLDTTPPQNVSISINNGAECFAAWAGQRHPTLNLSATGASFMRLSSNGETWSYWEPYNTVKTWTLSGDRGLRTVWFQCRDSCGNDSAPVSDDIWWVLFVDVTCRHPQRVYIERLAQQGIVRGCWGSSPIYCPNQPATRAEIAEAICKAAGKTWLDKATPTFADVPRTHPAYGWIERLADPASWAGVAVTDGCRIEGGQKYFCPDVAVTRQQAAKLLCRATGKSPMASCSGVFADVSPVNPYCGYVERLADASSWPGTVAVTGGCRQSGATRWFCAGNPLTRGQMAVFLVRAFGIPL